MYKQQGRLYPLQHEYQFIIIKMLEFIKGVD